VRYFSYKSNSKNVLENNITKLSGGEWKSVVTVYKISRQLRQI